MSNHLLIAGTGRAGTSFLVRYLERLGLETNLSLTEESALGNWDARANAGLEDMPLPVQGDRTLPYVIKSPWTFEYVQELLGNPALKLDAVIIPMRGLAEAAASRCVLELEAIHDSAPWMSELAQTWEHFGHTPGGLVYSINPLDQARLLAVGCYHLLDHLVRADIPIVLLAFPYFIEDPDYLFRKLSPVLPGTITSDFAGAAHSETVDFAKVRVGNELRRKTAGGGLRTSGPGHVQLDRVALARLLSEVRQKLAAADAQREQLTQRLAETEQRLTESQQHLAATEQRLVDSEAEYTRLVDSQRDNTRLVDTIAELQTRLSAIETSTTWRVARRFHKAANRISGKDR